jgi:hypothetical protein
MKKENPVITFTTLTKKGKELFDKIEHLFTILKKGKLLINVMVIYKEHFL